jgi:hypothetical protein
MMNNVFELSDEDVSVSSLFDLNLQEPNRSLYIAVILRAILDASKPKDVNESSDITSYRDESHRWLFKDVGVTSKDFIEICELAGLPSEKVRSLAFNVINSGDVQNERDKLYQFL